MSYQIPDREIVSDIWKAIKNRSIPVKSLTKSEYKDLDEVERNGDILYLVRKSNGFDLVYKGGSLSGGTLDHSLLENRDLENQHSIESITGLKQTLSKTLTSEDFLSMSDILKIMEV